MKLEQLVCPLWFAKKLPKDMETIHRWIYSDGDEFLCKSKETEESKCEEDEDYPAPTMQEMLPLVTDMVGVTVVAHI